MLDLVPARLLCADIFERLAGVWTAASDAVPQLGIVLSFERWVMLRDTALAALRPQRWERHIRVEPMLGVEVVDAARQGLFLELPDDERWDAVKDRLIGRTSRRRVALDRYSHLPAR